VWELKTADLTLSPIYYAALGVIEDNKVNHCLNSRVLDYASQDF